MLSFYANEVEIERHGALPVSLCNLNFLIRVLLVWFEQYGSSSLQVRGSISKKGTLSMTGKSELSHLPSRTVLLEWTAGQKGDNVFPLLMQSPTSVYESIHTGQLMVPGVALDTKQTAVRIVDT